MADRLERSNLPVTGVMGALSTVVAVGFALLDFRRAEAGLLSDPLYIALAITHAVVGASGVPGIIAWRAARASGSTGPSLLTPLRWQIRSLVVALIAMGLLGIVERGTLVPLAIGLALVNLVYYVPSSFRRGSNTVAGAVGAVILWQIHDFGTLNWTLHMLEFGSLVAVLAVGGAVVSRERAAKAWAHHELERVAAVDVLTGVGSRRATEAFLDAQTSRGGTNRPVSVVLLDVDHFKSVNDTHGHNVGDDVLKVVARLLRDRVRATDRVGRWGGEEFLVVCPDTSLADAYALAEALRARLASHSFAVVGKATASFGVAERRDGDTSYRLVGRADRALYEAKRSGRNRVVGAEGALVSMATPSPVPETDGALDGQGGIPSRRSGDRPR